MIKNFKFIALVIFVLALGIFLGACEADSELASKKSNDSESIARQNREDKIDNTLNRGLEVGARIPEFELTKSDGAKVSDKTLEGNPAVLVFWSLYCSKCKKETPAVNKITAKFSRKGVEIVGINIGETREEIEKGIKSFGISYPVAADPNKKVMKKFGAIGTPTIVFVDKTGKVKYYGNKLPEDSERILDSLT
ncbi:MAG: TlpA family protein disulfide reductase [Pyrinomonadaceae bacterium]|nr:TlpA family protein disulfide reductase [Pyrinomonadaceae bacterium]